MKCSIGFCVSEEKQEQELELRQPMETALEVPVRSVVRVRFPEDGRAFSYFNDRFDLHVGDRVYVSGKLAGLQGIVESVTTRFKIRLSDYQRVISKLDMRLRGTFIPWESYMAAKNPLDLTADRFRSWVIAPAEEDGEILEGEGYAFPLACMEECEDIERKVAERAVELCNEGKVVYLSLQDGIGTAFVKGTSWYEVNFRYEDGMISDLYCECPYPGLCKHALAACLVLLRYLNTTEDSRTSDNLSLIHKSFFMDLLGNGTQEITVG